MPKSKLGLVSVVDAYKGPWQHVNGMRHATIDVQGLGEGEGVKIEFEERTSVGLQVGAIGLGLGSNRVDTNRWERYRLCKTAIDGGTVPTFVDVVAE